MASVEVNYVDAADLLRDKIVNISMGNGVFYSGLRLVGKYPAVGMLVFEGPISSVASSGRINIRESHISVIEEWPS